MTRFADISPRPAFRRTRLFIALLVWLGGALLWGLPAQAQQLPPISLLADSIYLNQTTGVLTATGNVQVFFKDKTLEAAEIRYNSRTGDISATGPVRITQNDGTVVTADFAQLSSDLRAGLIRGARILINNQMQLAAAEARRTADRFNTLTNAVASSCRVCGSRPTPVWQIRAERIIYDEQKQAIYFSKAKMEIFGVPVFYLPTMRIPASGVKRATGFLRPVILSSSSLGDGIKLPYFITLGDSADMTITSTLNLQAAALLDIEFRKLFKNGSVRAFGATSVRDSSGYLRRGFVTASGKFDIGNNIALTFNGTAVTDNGFMRQYGYNNTDRLVDEIKISRYENHRYFSVAGAILQSLRADENNATVPLVLPEFYYRSYTTDPLLGGKIGYELNAVGLSRTIGQDVARVGGSIDWTVPLDLPNGIQATGFARADLNFYRVWNNPSYPQRVLTSFHPTIGAELRWPLENISGDTRQVLVPVVQLIYTANPGFNDPVPNEDSKLAEFDETNLFDLSRYPGRDASETGFRANIGASYTLYNSDGMELGLAGGVVLRSNPTTQFSQDILGAVRFELPSNFRIADRFLLDEALTLKRSESDFTITRENWDFGGNFLYLAPDPVAGSPVERAEGTFKGAYRFARNWEFTARWTRDFITNSNVSAAAGLNFRNECIEIGLSLSRRFTSSNTVPAVTDINLVIELAGFGGTSQNKWADSRCAY